MTVDNASYSNYLLNMRLFDAGHDPAALYRQVATIGAACSSPKRLQLLMLLSQAPKNVGRLATQLGQTVAATSAHLQALKRACLVDSDREGQQIRYRLADPGVYALLSAMMSAGTQLLPVAEQLADTFLHDPDSLVAVPMHEVHADIAAGRTTVIDLRPEDEYAAGHLPKARNIPYTELVQALASLPKRRRMVAYCRGPYCLSAIDTINAARDSGRNIKRLAFGVNEWRSAGFPLESAI